MTTTYGTCTIADCEDNGVRRFTESGPLPRAWHLCARHLAELEASPHGPLKGDEAQALAAFFSWLGSRRK